MRFERLALENVGPFLGRQEMDLRTTDPKRPVILIGGLNGCGKTTFLESILLILYGKLSVAARSGGQSYPKYLENLINRDAEDGSCIELCFRHVSEDGDRLYRIVRSWFHTRSGGVQEKFEAYVDDCYDEFLSEHWLESVDQFLPSRLSGLFFFDGEKIESMADPKQSPALISSALDSLLGADVITQLRADLEVVIRKKSKELQPPEDQAELDRIERELEEATQQRTALKQAAASLVDPLKRSHNQLQDLQEELKLKGGDIAARRSDLTSRQERIESEIDLATHQLRTLAAGPLPLALVRPQLKLLVDQARSQLDYADNQKLVEILESRDADLLEQLRQARFQEDAMSSVQDLLEQDRTRRNAQPMHPAASAKLTRDTVGQIEHLLNQELSRLQEEAADTLKKLEELNLEEASIKKQLAAAPSEEELRPLVLKIQKAEKDIKEQERKSAKTEGELERVNRLVENTSHLLESKLRDRELNSISDEDSSRFIEHAARVNQTLKLFRDAFINRHIQGIQTLIFNGYRQLLRKAALFDDLQIDPGSCALQLLSKDGVEIPVKRLSAGERQLLATSILWGFAKASGRPLPVIIDTPLGRLDSSHRTNLVEHYFPFASHQVMILSTDEEIHAKYYDLLKPSIAREYTLEHDIQTRTTTIEKGYAFKESELTHAD